MVAKRHVEVESGEDANRFKLARIANSDLMPYNVAQGTSLALTSADVSN
jgi:hypothetical protein